MGTLKEQLRATPSPSTGTIRRFEDGELIAGVLLEIVTITTKKGDREILVLEDEDGGTLRYWLGHTVLRRKLAELDVHPGDTIGIECTGTPDGKNYVGYKVLLFERADQRAADPERHVDLDWLK